MKTAVHGNALLGHSEAAMRLEVSAKRAKTVIKTYFSKGHFVFISFQSKWEENSQVPFKSKAHF